MSIAKKNLQTLYVLIFSIALTSCNKEIIDNIDTATCSNKNQETTESQHLAHYSLNSDNEAENSNCDSPTDEISTPEQNDELTGENEHESANGYVRVNYVTRNYTDAQNEKIAEVARRIEIVLNSYEFRDAVLNFEWKDEFHFANTEMSNQEVYDYIMGGMETLSGIEDNEMNVDVTMYYSRRGVVGYTYPSSDRIWTNSKFFNRYSFGGVAGNLVHEWCHKLGFKHDSNRTSRRAYSVPYAIGYIVEELVDKLSEED